MMMMMVKRA